MNATDARQQRGLEIAARSRIEHSSEGAWPYALYRTVSPRSRR